MEEIENAVFKASNDDKDRYKLLLSTCITKVLQGDGKNTPKVQELSDKTLSPADLMAQVVKIADAN